jgi:hypothetical protein
MNTIINILQGIFFWAFVLGALIFGTLGYQIGSFSAYDTCVHHPKTFNTPAYKYTYHNNVFYIFYKFIAPSKFDDVKSFEKEALKKDYEDNLKSLESNTSN